MLALITIISYLFKVFTYMILIRVVATWIPEFNQSRIIQFISYYVDPYLNFFRQFIPPLGMIDISAMVAIFALYFLEK